MPETPAERGGAGGRVVAPPGPLFELSPRWIRVKCGNVLLADSRRALLLRQYGPGRLPTYYFPPEDVRVDLLERMPDDPGADGITHWSVKTRDEVAENSARVYAEPPPDRSALIPLLRWRLT